MKRVTGGVLVLAAFGSLGALAMGALPGANVVALVILATIAFVFGVAMLYAEQT